MQLLQKEEGRDAYWYNGPHCQGFGGCTSVHDLLEKGSDVVAAAQAILKVNGNDKDLKRARGTDADKVATERDENVDIDLNTVPSDEGDENIGVDLNALPSVRIKQRQKLQHNLKKNHADERSHGGGNGDPLLSDESPDSLNKHEGRAWCSGRAYRRNRKVPGLSPSLRILCGKLRNWIDNQNGIAAEPMNAARGKARAAKEKEKKLKERLKLNMDTTVLSPNEAAAVSDEENKDIISQIKEAQEVKRAAINDMATIDKGGGLWTKPLMVEKGIAYWKLDGYCDNTTMLLQEYGDDELMANKDKWFIFTEDEEKAIEEHVAT
ncbi:hypothetical protein U9M48_024181, partial [Paspalum notatum var. saurae]